MPRNSTTEPLSKRRDRGHITDMKTPIGVPRTPLIPAMSRSSRLHDPSEDDHELTSA
ncbi:hypothetical protein B005_0229 [Nocardiopsis alba ATCC BAA-2165]|uniref:Uncharacterized protein n=1 Tax=Nocardiopsis alba (strain ATCC BAA-2165 / BE74) TaxID=1205910 RepID=J7L5S9_NOCAA|nr:hypothetical protein B005_0229 [Nocardiopsis alba ATCC BAA-2165]